MWGQRRVWYRKHVWWEIAARGVGVMMGMGADGKVTGGLLRGQGLPGVVDGTGAGGIFGSAV